LTDVQKTILKRKLTDAGLTQEQAEHICLLLSLESEKVQQAFYYRCQGYTYAQIGDIVGCSLQNVWDLLQREKLVKNYLQKVEI